MPLVGCGAQFRAGVVAADGLAALSAVAVRRSCVGAQGIRGCDAFAEAGDGPQRLLFEPAHQNESGYYHPSLGADVGEGVKGSGEPLAHDAGAYPGYLGGLGEVEAEGFRRACFGTQCAVVVGRPFQYLGYRAGVGVLPGSETRGFPRVLYDQVRHAAVFLLQVGGYALAGVHVGMPLRVGFVPSVR